MSVAPPAGSWPHGGHVAGWLLGARLVLGCSVPLSKINKHNRNRNRNIMRKEHSLNEQAKKFCGQAPAPPAGFRGMRRRVAALQVEGSYPFFRKYQVYSLADPEPGPALICLSWPCLCSPLPHSPQQSIFGSASAQRIPLNPCIPVAHGTFYNQLPFKCNFTCICS